MSREDMDQLSRDSCDAIAAGMSYGKYMARKHEHRTSCEKIKPEISDGEAIFRCCGKVFKKDKYFRVYCSRSCREMKTQEGLRNRGG